MRSDRIDAYVALHMAHEDPSDEIFDQLEMLWFAMTHDEQEEARHRLGKLLGGVSA